MWFRRFSDYLELVELVVLVELVELVVLVTQQLALALVDLALWALV